MKKLNNLDDMLRYELNDLHHSAKKQLKTFNKLSERVHSPELRKDLTRQAQAQLANFRRITKTFDILDRKPGKGTRNALIKELIHQGMIMVKKASTESVRDACVVSFAQELFHYDIVGLGTASAYAKKLGQPEIATLLHDALDETKKSDAQLSKLAEQKINAKAMPTGKRRLQHAG